VIEMFDYGTKPINRTAGLVTGQSGCATDDTLSDEQLRENLVSKWKALTNKIKTMDKGSPERKILGKEQAELQKQISNLRPKRKYKDLRDHILDVLREELSEFEFRRLIHKASIRADEQE
jgi:hypothetical protein